MTTQKRERRDWTLLIFIIPIGILLILFVGQLAARLLPFWSLNADMNSNLEPDTSSARPFALLEPILPQILTPLAWLDTYLTPGASYSFPPFLTFEPTASSSATAVTPTGTVPTPMASSTPPPTSISGTPPSGTPPNGGGGGNGTPPTSDNLCHNPNATNNGGPLPCQYPPNNVPGCTDSNALNYNPLATIDDGSCTYNVSGCTDSNALNYNSLATIDDGSCTYNVSGCTDSNALNYNPLATIDDGSCTYNPPPPTTCTDPHANNQGQPLPCDYGTLSTLPSAYGTPVTPVPSEIGTLPNNVPGEIADGTYIVINLQVTVGAVPDDNYDLVFYEWNGGTVFLDWIIIGISNSPDGSEYYEVFNWGNGTPDLNSNVGDVAVAAGGEGDNQVIPSSELYDPDGAGSAPQTGILIDVDTAASDPPPNTYNYVVIISPPGGSGQDAQVDAIDVVEEPTPAPTP